MTATATLIISEAERAVARRILTCLTTAGNLKKVLDSLTPDETFAIFALNVKFEEPISEPAWRSELFTEQDRKLIHDCVSDEIRDSWKELTIEACDELSMADCMGYVYEDTEDLVDCMRALKEGYADGEDYRSCDHDNHLAAIEFMKRFSLVNEAETELTKLGEEMLERWG